MSNKTLRLTRNQIAQIVGNNPEAIRAFENLFAASGGAAWVNIDFTDSNLSDILTRLHADLQSIGEADETSSDTTKDKHVSDNQLKVAYDDIAANLVSIKSTRVLHWLTM